MPVGNWKRWRQSGRQNWRACFPACSIAGEALRFSSPATYLAQFLNDLADGAAWSKWYYAGFDGLRALPMSLALREALTREPIIGETALLLVVNDGRAEKILRALNEPDCRAVLTSFCSAHANGETVTLSSVHLEMVYALAQRSLTLCGEVASSHRDALRLYLTVRREVPTLRPTLMLLDVIVHSPLRAGGASAVEIGRQLRSDNASPETGSEHSVTPFGGIFYLLPRLMEIDLEECAATLPKFAGSSAVALVRFLVLLKCFGRQRCRASILRSCPS